MNQFLRTWVQRIDRGIQRIGHGLAWLVLAMVGVEFLIVILRYFFNTGWIAMQESVLYMHSLVFLVGAAYTLKLDGHVRVDIFYRRMQPRARAWVNLLGVLFLLWPVCIFIAWASWDYVWVSWARWETSVEAGGLAYVYVLKTFILIFSALLCLQGLSLFMRSLLGIVDAENLTIESDS